MHSTPPVTVCVCSVPVGPPVLLTLGVPHVDVAFPAPVVGLREGLPVGEHVACLQVRTLAKAVVIQPGSHRSRAHLAIGCPVVQSDVVKAGMGQGVNR